MEIKIDGEAYKIDDAVVREYVEALDAEESEIELVPPNRYVFGVNVTHTGELAKAGDDIRAFIDKIGDGEVEVQVSVNAKLNEFKDMVVGFKVGELEPAIGSAEMTEDDYYDEDYEEDDE